MNKTISLKKKDKLKLLMKFLNGKILWLFIFNIVFLIVIGLFPSFVLNYQLQLFDSIGITKELSSVILRLILTLSIVQILFELTNLLFNKINYLFAEKIRLSFQNQIYNKMQTLKIEYFENAEFYNLLYRIRENGANNVIGALTNWFDLVRNLIQVVSLSITLMRIHWVFPILTISFSIPYVFLFRKMNFNHYFYLLDHSAKTRKNHYLIDLLTKREYAKEVRIFGLFHYFYDYHVRLRDELFDETYKLVKKYTFYAGIISVFKRIIQVFCFALGIYFISQKMIGIGQYAILYQTIVQIQSALLQTVQCYKSQDNQQYHLDDIAKFQHLEEQKIAIHHAAHKRPSVCFNHVSFTYPLADKSVLRDINLTIPFGQKIAVVGENGSGKTTFAYLLSGLYQPTSGHIMMGEQDVKELASEDKDFIGFVFQDFIQFHGTIRDNIELGSQRKLSDEEVIEALKMSGAWEFVDSLPGKMNTVLGFLESDSVDLSGGQWQKLAIARGLLNCNRSLLILDECAASLDPFAESYLYEQFHQLTDGKTAISISHRLGITQFVDRILVFHDGQIVEDGTHEELMKKQGFYYAMYIAQRELYQ